MAISTDTSTNFPAGLSGYTQFDAANIDDAISGDVKLVAGSPLDAAIRTPGINVSGWTNAIRSVAIDATEAVGYSTRFLVSFDDWAGVGTRKFYKAYRSGVWVAVADDLTSAADLIDIVLTEGMGIAELETVYTWPDLADIGRLQFLVGLARDVGGGTGSLAEVAVSYGTEVLSLPGEGAASGTLTIQPDFPIEPSYTQYFEQVDFIGYSQLVPWGTALRKVYSVSWTLDATDAGTVLTLLRGAQSTPFNWQPFDQASASKFICLGAPLETEIGLNAFRITATLEQRL